MYKWDARDYQKNSIIQLKWGRELIDKLKLRGNESVLDIGCGDGKVTAEIAAIVRDGKATGIDSSPEMISLACRTFPPCSYTNLNFIQMDMRELTFENGYDVVFSNAALHWVNDHPSILNGISRSLRKEGRILLQMGGRGNVADMMSVVAGITQDYRWKSYFAGFISPYSFYGLEEYGKWLPGAGLEPLRVELLRKDLTQQGKEGLASWFRTTWHPFIHRVPEIEQRSFIDEAIEAYLLAHPADADGMVHLAAVRLEVEARKI
jgi:trans-aconitate 2-methyltransferase